MKKKITMLFLVAAAATTYAQDPGLGIGKGLPDASAILDVNSTSKGVLIPRLVITDLEKFELDGNVGGDGTESILVYNTQANGATDGNTILKGFYYWTKGTPKGKWELITSQSQLDEVIGNLKKEIYEEIEKITKIPGENDTDLSYLVAFTPNDANASKGKFSYLVPTTVDGKTTYDLKEISFEDIIKGTETDTFFLAKKEDVIDPSGTNGVSNVVVGYYYFSEDVIKEWKSDEANAGKPIEEIDVSKGTYLDVAGIASSTFINNLVENKDFIENTFINIEGNITLHHDAEKGYYFITKTPKGDGTYDSVEYLFNNMETKTSIGKSEVLTDGELLDFITNTTKPTKEEVKKGQIFYEYTTETDNGKETNYINLTADLISTITNNTQLQENISNIVNNFIEGGSNVYYGVLDPEDAGKPDAEKVLFSVDTDGKREIIDISQNIINEITSNEDVQNIILNVSKVELEEAKVVAINTSFNGVEVYKLLKRVEVKKASDSQLYNNVLSAPVALGAKATKVLSIQLIDTSGVVVLNTARDIKLEAGNLTFMFGNGQTILPLKEGFYDIVVEFAATE